VVILMAAVIHESPRECERCLAEYFNSTRSQWVDVVKAMAAGISQNVMDWEDFVAVMDADETKHRPRGPYKKKS